MLAVALAVLTVAFAVPLPVTFSVALPVPLTLIVIAVAMGGPRLVLLACLSRRGVVLWPGSLGLGWAGRDVVLRVSQGQSVVFLVAECQSVVFLVSEGQAVGLSCRRRTLGRPGLLGCGRQGGRRERWRRRRGGTARWLLLRGRRLPTRCGVLRSRAGSGGGMHRRAAG